MSSWIRIFKPRPTAAIRLVCLPHAGGAASFFHEWPDALGPDMEVCAIQYPGRENRIREPFAADIASMADGIAHALREWLDLPIVVFGHSMGAVVGHEVVRRLFVAHPGAVRHLVVSACAAPHRKPEPLARELVAHWRDDDVVAMMKSLSANSGENGTELLDDPDMREVLLPAIRDDHRLIQSYRWQPGPIPTVDVTAFAGARDPAVKVDAVRAWSELTRGAFECRTFSGGHFYVREDRAELVRALTTIGQIVLQQEPSR